MLIEVRFAVARDCCSFEVRCGLGVVALIHPIPPVKLALSYLISPNITDCSTSSNYESSTLLDPISHVALTLGESTPRLSWQLLFGLWRAKSRSPSWILSVTDYFISPAAFRSNPILPRQIPRPAVVLLSTMPSQFLGIYTAVYPYAPQNDLELALEEGDLLYVLEKSTEDDWWKARKKAASPDQDEPEGLIPNNYVKEVCVKFPFV
jgi:hypothetical protein